MLQTVCIVISMALAVVTVYTVVRAVVSMVGVLRVGQPAKRVDHPANRSVTMLKETFGHTRMFQWRWVGVMHWFVYFGFLILSTAVLSGIFQLFDPTFQFPLIGHWFVYEWLCEVIGVLSTVGIVFLIVYRQTHLPAKLGRRSRFFGSTFWQAYFVEAMALLEGAAILFIRGAERGLELNSTDPAHGSRFHFPIASWVGQWLHYPSGVGSEQALKNLVIIIATIKVVSALAWLIVVATNLTMGIAWHRFTAWFNIWFKREAIGRDTDGATTALGAMKPLTVGGQVVTLDDVENDRIAEDAVLGAGSIQDFSWKGILDFTTCTECGRCQSQCPAWNTEKPLSPKHLVMSLRDHAYASAPYLQSGETEGTVAAKPLIGHTDQDPAVGASDEVLDWFYNPVTTDGADGGFVIDEDVLWSCTSCGACVQQCPVDIEHVDHIMDMRRYQVLVESNFPSELNGLFRGLEGKGNPWNMAPTARLDWAKDLDFEVPVVGEDLESLDSVDWLFWVGCAGAYEDRAKKTTRAVAELLNIAGISFGVLGNGETCTGDPARRAGNEFVFQGLAQQNAETFKEYQVKQVVTTCAHCFNTLKNEYKEFGLELEVVHHTQLLNRLVREGRLTPVNTGAGAHQRSITYHDPCYIGRHNGVYTPPRELLQILPGAEYVEMPRNSERSFCCGAGGARMWMEERLGSRINRNRTDEAVATGADQIAVGCPFCRVMLSDGLTAAQADGTAREEVEVLDVAQMLLASVKGEQATRLAPGQGATAAPAAKAAVSEAKAPGEAVTVPDDPSSLFDAPAPAEPARPAGETPEGAEAKAAEPKSAGEPDEVKPAPGGSLFDDPTSLFDTPADKGSAEKPSASEPEAKAAPEPSSGGSLFDIAAEAPAAPEAKAAPAETAPAEDAPTPAQTPAAQSSGAASTPRTDVDIDSVGSLFDIDAPEGGVTAVAAPAAPAAPATPTAPAEPSPAAQSTEVTTEPAAPADTVAEEPAAKAEPATPAQPATAPAPAASSGTASSPRTDVDIDSASSLFDIEAPAGSVAAAPAPAPEATPAAEATEAATRPAPEAPAAAAPVARAEPESAKSEPAPAAAPAAASGTASSPRTDVDLASVSSLFDIEAPSGSVVAAPAPAPAPAAPAAPAAEAMPEPTPEPEAIQPEASATVDEPADEAPADAATTEAPTQSEPAPTRAPAAVTSNGEAHEPRTDVDINALGSLFEI